MTLEGITTPRNEVLSDANFDRLVQEFGYDSAFFLRQGGAIPDYSSVSVTEIDFNHLANDGTENLFIDLDLTIRRANEPDIDPEIVEHLDSARRSGAIKGLWIVTDSEIDTSAFENQIGANGTYSPIFNSHGKHKKTSPFYWEVLLRDLSDINPESVIMVGDRYLSDIKNPARFTSLKTCKVDPLGDDYWFDKLPGRNIRNKDNISLLRARFQWGIVLDALEIERPEILKQPEYNPKQI